MKNTIIKIVLLSLFQQVCFGQTTFQKTYGNLGSGAKSHAVIQTSDGGYMLAGAIINSPYIASYFIKTNPFGDTTWTKIIEGTWNWMNSIIQTTDGGFIMTGEGINDSLITGDNISIMKINSVGDTLWTKCMGARLYDYGQSIQQTTDGGYIITGNANNGTNNRACLIKLNSAGDTLWTKTYGGAGSNYGYDVKQTADGGYIVVGSNSATDTSNGHVLLLKTTSTGSLSWTKTYGGSSNEEGHSVAIANDGGYMIAGITQSFGAGTNNDYYLIKTDVSGNLSWSKTIGTNGWDYARSIQKTNDGDYVIAGRIDSSGQFFNAIIKINSLGDTVWTKRYGAGEGRSVKQTTDGGFIISGATSAYLNAGAVSLIKTDANGNTECGSSPTNIIIDTAATIVSTPVLTVSSGIAMHHPVFIPTSVGEEVTTLCFTSSINEINNDESISIYPNPSTGIFTIESTGSKIKEVKVMDVIGSLVISHLSLGNTSEIIDMSGVSKGIYFVQIMDEKLNVVNKKVVVQ